MCKNITIKSGVTGMSSKVWFDSALLSTLVVRKLFCILSGFGPCSLRRQVKQNFCKLKKHICVSYIFCVAYPLFLCLLAYWVCETVSLCSLCVSETHCVGQDWLQTWTS